MTGVDDMVRAAERSLGLAGRPNTITRWYSQRNGPVFATAPWCNQSITYWANASGNAGPVCFGRDYAYGPWTLDDPNPTVTGNVYEDDGSAIPYP